MESDLGKLFIGGISWDTNEDRLREYFTNYGEVVEAVIMKDRTTGRARGFGFVVFADPSVAERVVMEKHTIDGRVVEAKKAVPRDDQHVLNRNTNTNNININNSNAHVSPGPTRTKKIFVGGLASTVTESDFKTYFDQFGNITDVVVMYDHNTQRPRGFGFITYDSEDAVDKVLLTTFHELNNKMVEVKRAVPKELSPAPTMRSPIGSYSSFGLNRVNNFLEGYPQGFSPNSIRGYGMRIDGRSGGSIASGRGRYPAAFAPAGYGMGLNIEACLNSNYVGNGNFNNNNFSYGRGLNLNNLYNGDSGRFNSSSTNNNNSNNNHHHPIGYNGVANSPGSIVNSNPRNLWGLSNLNYNTATSGNSNNSPFVGSGIGNFGGFGNNGMNWGGSTSSIIEQGSGSGSGYGNGNLGYGTGEISYGIGGNNYGRNIGNASNNPSSFDASNTLYDDGVYADLCNDISWRTASSELEGSSPFDYGLTNVSSETSAKASSGYNGAYTDRQPNRGVAT